MWEKQEVAGEAFTGSSPAIHLQEVMQPTSYKHPHQYKHDVMVHLTGATHMTESRDVYFW